MVSELREVQDFLARHPPFSALPAQALAALVRHLTIRYLRRGSAFPPADADPAGLCILREGAMELRDVRGVLVDKLAEGDSLEAAGVGRESASPLSGITVEDTLVYVLGSGPLAGLRRDHPGFDAGLVHSVAERLRRALDAAPEAPRVGGNLLRLTVSDLVSRGPVTAPPGLSLREAADLMTRERVSSLLVVADGALAGIVTDRDLRSRCSPWAGCACTTCRSPTRRACTASSRRMTCCARSPPTRSTSPTGGSRRLIDLEIARLGEPPVPFAWIATGSQGRGELTLGSDQDNALLLDDAFDPARHGAYFEALARAVNDGLHACGYVHCSGGVMACTPEWRQPLRAWQAYFLDWITHTDHRKVTLAVNFLDMRTVWGDDGLRQRLTAEILPRCAQESVFSLYLAGHSLGNAPPLGFFRNFVPVRSGAHEGRLDLKLHGLLPVVDLARVHALAGEVEAVSTLSRLQLAADRGTLTREGAETLQAAFDFIWTIRARHQPEKLRANAPVDSFVDPGALTVRERGQLKDAFAAIATLQRALRTAYGDRLPM